MLLLKVTVMTMITVMMMITVMAMKGTTGRQMKEVPGLKARFLSVGLAGVWAVDTDFKVYYRNNTHGTTGRRGTDWVFVSAGFRYVEVGTDVVYAMNTSGHVLTREGINSTNPTGTHWVPINVRQIFYTVSPAGQIWGLVPSTSVIYDPNGPPNPSGPVIGTGYFFITAGMSGLWAVSMTKEVRYRHNTYGQFDAGGSSWTVVPEKNMSFLSAAYANVFGIADGQLYVRKGMSLANPTGNRWILIRSDTDLRVVDAVHDFVWAIKGDYSVWITYFSRRC
ncbi:perivitellin-2 31 kDa subunit-like [Babylonia areolata]|uniref:perivitellin-2 31 kDa subunit-like n=1 Tax=Babylonia areolata TaxID=304850 RepID=UPI003FD561FF